MPRGHIPYRGEARPRLYGHPSRPDPYAKARNEAFWIVLVAIGVCIGILAAQNDFPLAKFFFAIYALFFVIMIFAAKDAKRIETITPDDEDLDQDGLAEDYLDQLDLMAKGGSKFSPKALQRGKYRPILKNGSAQNGCLSGFFIYAAIFGVFAFVTFLSIKFGKDSIITLGISLVIGFIAIGLYFFIAEIRERSKDRPRV